MNYIYEQSQTEAMVEAAMEAGLTQEEAEDAAFEELERISDRENQYEPIDRQDGLYRNY